MNDFVAVDVETANPNLSSICQIGIACFEDGKVQKCFESLVNPEDYFDAVNVSIHGIAPEMVTSSPRWCDIYPSVADLLRGTIVVSHTAFDRTALHQACEKYRIPEQACTWLDSARVARRTWDCFARSGYGLSNVASYLSIQFGAHDALEDARCAGEVLVRAISATGLSVGQWLKRVRLPIHAHYGSKSSLAFEPNPNGPLFGESLAFTGTLSLTRHEAAAIAAESGCRIDHEVTKHTTLLLVGDQDIRRLAGHSKSSKHQKAEDLIRKGQNLRIIGESDFRKLVAQA